MRKRITKYKHLHSNRFRYLYSSIPLISASGLVVIGGLMLGCGMSNTGVYATDDLDEILNIEESDDGIMPLSVGSGVTLTIEGETNLQESAITGKVAYITKDFTITADGDYSIYVQSTTGDSDLVNGAARIPTLAQNGVSPSSMQDNSWGYTVAETTTEVSNLTYNAMPTVSTYAIQEGGQTENKAYRLAFAAKFGEDASAGHYRTNVVLSVAAKPEEVTNYYSITYDANGSTAGITPVMQAAESSRDTYNLALAEGKDLRKSGYSFIGWAESSDAVDPQYIAGSTIALTADKPNKTLYAVWRTDKAWDSITKMQELTPNTCRGLALETSKQLTDERDGKSYWVTKLADGNCWMTQNLDYDIKPEELPGVLRYDWTTGLSPKEKPGAWPSYPSSNTTDGIPRYYDPGNYYKVDTSHWSAAGCHEVADGFANTGCTSTAGWKTAIETEEEKHFHVGNHYNWYAATNGSWQGANVAGMDASDSVCPSGWRLPKGGVDVNASYGTLLLTANEVTTDVRSLAGVYKMVRGSASSIPLRKSPIYFLPGGSIYDGQLGYAGNIGRYWASTAFDAHAARYFIITDSVINPGSTVGSYYGNSVRCLVPSM